MGGRSSASSRSEGAEVGYKPGSLAPLGEAGAESHVSCLKEIAAGPLFSPLSRASHTLAPRQPHLVKENAATMERTPRFSELPRLAHYT